MKRLHETCCDARPGCQRPRLDGLRRLARSLSPGLRKDLGLDHLAPAADPRRDGPAVVAHWVWS